MSGLSIFSAVIYLLLNSYFTIVFGVDLENFRTLTSKMHITTFCGTATYFFNERNMILIFLIIFSRMFIELSEAVENPNIVCAIHDFLNHPQATFMIY